MNTENLTLMIQTCDGYSDLWKPHLDFLTKNWPDCPFRRILVTDAPTDRVFPGVEVFSAGEGCHMPARLEAVLPHVSSEYVLLTLDDYFPIRPISTEAISRLVDIMDTQGLDYLRLFPMPPAFRPWQGRRGLFRIPLNTDYAVNLYPGLWRRSFLEATLPGPEDIWAYEVSLTHTARRLGARCAMTYERTFPVLDVIRKGKLLHKAARQLARRGISLPGRDTVPRREELRIFLFTWGKQLLPRPAARWVKKWLTNRGYSFFTDQYEALYDRHSAD